MWIGLLWAGLRVAMWMTHVGGKFCHGLLEKSLIQASCDMKVLTFCWWASKFWASVSFCSPPHKKKTSS